jgi:hypothetical protein
MGWYLGDDREAIDWDVPSSASTTMRAGSFRGFPSLGQHIESQCVAVCVLIAFQYCHGRQHMPDAIVVEDVTLTRFAHREAIDLVFIIVGYDDFPALRAAAGQ